MAKQSTFRVEDAEWSKTIIKVLEEFRKINPDITANQMLTFLHIGVNPGVSQKKLTELVNVDDATVSRISALLSERGSRGREGLKMIEIKLDENDYRFRVQHLSRGGKLIFDSLRDIMMAFKSK
ncbi:MarR family transcriptional regulator [Bradyrhizobium sp. 83012]|uniref:MarR family transcriptional regulator n=1 Tax=Bradyrhizobium aeschynomenes TaxID=2734909 RepID=A0ABX2C8J3_9BRAD|nr:MarR family transcriptional regulator [Bradyrhizobium aeschynomenes]NPU64581.1 MarR family transcriptional regulator [Bradyrhizobium aeschynomenes]